MNNLPVITKNLLVINLLVFLAQLAFATYGIQLEDWLGLHFVLAQHFYPWQLVTYMFLHSNPFTPHGTIAHLLFNMFALWMFGRSVESTLGPRRYFIFYMVCGIGAGVMQEIVQFVEYLSMGLSAYSGVMVGGVEMPMGEFLNMWTTIGASGAIYGVLLAFAMLYPDARLFVFPIPVPIPAKYYVFGYAVLELLMGFGGSGDGVAHFAHLGGMLFGLLLILYWQGRLKLPQWENPFKGYSYRKIVNEQPIAGFNTPEEEWNARRREREIEVDRILDKVRKHGYGSLSEREKRVLFNGGK